MIGWQRQKQSSRKEKQIAKLERVLRNSGEEFKQDVAEKMYKGEPVPTATFETSQGKELGFFSLDYLLRKGGLYCPTSELIRWRFDKVFYGTGIKRSASAFYSAYLEWLNLNEEQKRNRRIMTAITYNDASIFGYDNINEKLKEIFQFTRLGDYDFEALMKWSRSSKTLSGHHPRARYCEYPVRAITKLRVTANRLYPEKFSKLDVKPSEIREIYYSWLKGKHNLPRGFFKFSLATKMRIFFEEIMKENGITFDYLHRVKPKFPVRFEKLVHHMFNRSYRSFLDFIYPYFNWPRRTKHLQQGKKIRLIETKKHEERLKCYEKVKEILERERKIKLTGNIAREQGIFYTYIRPFFDESVREFNRAYEIEFLRLNEDQIRLRNLLYFAFRNRDHGFNAVQTGSLAEIRKRANLSGLESTVSDYYISGHLPKDIAESLKKDYHTVDNAMHRAKCKLTRAIFELYPEKFRTSKSDEDVRKETIHCLKRSLGSKKAKFGQHRQFLEYDFQRKLKFMFDYILEKEGIEGKDLPKQNLSKLFGKYLLAAATRDYFGSYSQWVCFADNSFKPYQFEINGRWKNIGNVLDALSSIIEEEANKFGIDTRDIRKEDVEKLLTIAKIKQRNWTDILVKLPGWKNEDFVQFYSLMSGKVKIGKTNYTLEELCNRSYNRDIILGDDEREDIVRTLSKYYNIFKEERILHKIAQLNKGLISSVIKKRFSRYLDQRFSYEELEEAGHMGIIQYARDYDPNLSSSSTWFWNAIKFGIFKRVNEKRREMGSVTMPWNLSPNRKQLFDAMQQEGISSVNDANIGILASRLGWGEEKIKRIYQLGQDELSLDAPVKYHGHKQEDPRDHWIDTIASSITEEKDCLLRDNIMHAIESLPSIQRNILALRFGIVDGELYSMGDVGKFLGISRERIRQISEKAIGSLKERLKSFNPN